MSGSFFSQNYAEARRRFLDSATVAGADIRSYAIDAPAADELAIDVAILGPANVPTLVISSGIHGVEGFFGSAVQLALLDRLQQTSRRADIRYVLIHALNPFGFSHIRRVNEDNVDLNRNFLTRAGDYQGAPEGYTRLNGLLNPESAPSRYEPFRLKALWNICRHGLHPLKQAVAGGQYQYPRGLFYGGHGPCQSTKHVQEHCDSWMGDSSKIIHIDLHTGLGRYGTYKLLLSEAKESEEIAWYAEAFGADCVEPLSTPDGTAYRASGLFGEWMQTHFHAREYRFVGAEFGTYDVLRMLAALRAENRAHHYSPEDSQVYQEAKAELRECFCPANTNWRQQVVKSSLKIIDQAMSTLQ